jgi:clan AA aspartic protease
VDERNRALTDVFVRRTPSAEHVSVTTWIDTAFDGHLVFSRQLIEELELESLVETDAVLADGRRVTLETFVCYVEWFGSLIPLQVISSDGQFPLLGTGLLEDRVLHIDYSARQLSLE